MAEADSSSSEGSVVLWSLLVGSVLGDDGDAVWELALELGGEETVGQVLKCVWSMYSFMLFLIFLQKGVKERERESGFYRERE